MRTETILVKDRLLTVREDGVIFYNGKVKTQYTNDGGYYKIAFNKHSHYVHRLVAMCFLENTLNKETVNHKDGNKANNNLSNLEWNTYIENNKHARDMGLAKMPPIYYNLGRTGFLSHKGKRVFRAVGSVIEEYGSLREAERLTKTTKHKIVSDIKKNNGTWFE